MEVSKFKLYQEVEPFRVFILEDDLDLGPVIENVIRNMSSTIILDWATSVDNAISYLRAHLEDPSQPPYDMIVADLFLEGKTTGIQFWKTCQELFPKTPILMTSSLSLDRFFKIIGKDSITPPYLQKPFTLNECKQMFEALLSYSSHEKTNQVQNQLKSNKFKQRPNLVHHF
jgi:DNA-binding response OmpR family regulator